MSFADIWDSLGSTVKSIGKATPLATMGGLVYDLAHSTYDGEDQTFGDYLNMLGKRVGQMADPLLNPETLTGKAVTGVGHGLETAYREGVSEPIVTWDTVMQHATSKGGQFSEIFHSDSWARAYKVAQDRSMGQSAAVGNSALMGGEDPLDPGAYQDIHRRHGWKATGVSGTYDFLANWFLDPTVVGGKAAKGVKAAAYLRKITKADHQAGIGNLMETEDYRKVFGVNLGNISRSAGLKTRTEAVIGTHESTGFVDGKNAAQIRAGMPELARSTQGSQIASLLADTNKLTSSADKINARQRILRVAYGDEVAIGDLKGELAHIDDQLNNMQQESVVGLERAEAEDSVFSFTRGRKFDSPDVLADAERQVANQEGAVKLLQSSADDLNSILDVQGAARTATLRESAAGRRGLARAEGRGLLRSGEVNTGYERYDALANRGMDLAKRFGQIGAIETLYQHSLAGMPLRIIKKLHVDMPVAASDALRTSRLQGIVNLHDVDGTGRQLDSMMFRAKLAPNDRMSLQSEYMGARTEAERMSIIAKVENASVRSMAKRHTGQDLDTQKAVDAFIGELANRGSMRRDSMASALNGRAYAATKLDRAVQSMGQDGAANWREMRVDQIDDDGIPVSLPILETQGANLLPLMDVDHAERTLRRQGSRLSKLAKAWQSERFEFDKLSRQKAAGGLILDDVLEARRKMADHVAEVGDELTRIWKFGVLMRLGYPLRILADDHMRIWAKIGAGAMYHPMWQEGVRKFGYNAMRRRTDLKARRIGLQGRIRTLNDLIGDEDNVKRFRDTTAEMKSLDRKLAKVGGGAEADTLTARRNALDQMRGDDVNELIAERDELQALFDDKAWQGELPEHIAKKAGVERAGIDKRRMGEGQIQIAGGHTLDDAFAGEYGHAARKMISSDETFEMNLLDSEAKTYASSSAGNWRTIMPDEPEHGAAWEWAINKQLRQSQVAMRFIRGESVEDVTKWLKTAEGRALRKRIPWHTHDPEAYAHRVKAMVDEYVPEGSIREAAVRRNVRKGDLQAHIGDDLNRAPAVHGGQVDVNLGGLGGISGVINGAMSRMYRYISEVPTDALSRHPFFMAMYRQEARDLGAIRVAAARREGKELSTADLNEITKLARDRARHELKRTLFDMSAHSNAAATMRWVSPFFSAHQEGLQRWWRLASDDPSVVRRFTQAFNAPREMGLVIDENGNPVKPGDPISGDHRILVPKPIARMMGFGDDQPITVNENSFNLVLQGGLTNPGFGPMVALPVEYAAQHLPDQQAIVKLARAMNPVRPGDPSDVIMPATIRRVMAAVQGEKNGEFAYYYTRNIQDSVVQFQLDKHRMPNRAEFARIERAAKDQTTAVAWLRVGQNALSGAPATPDSRFAVQRNAWHRLMDESRINGKGFEWAEKVFIDKYGPAFFPLIQSTSNNPAGMDATGQTVAAIKRHRGLLDLLPAKLHTMVVGPESAGAYSGEAAAWLRNNQIKPGDPATYYSNEAPGEAGLSGLVSKGWSDYNKAMSGLNAQAFSMGLASYRDSPELTAMKGQVVDALSKRNFAWWDDYNDYNPEEFETLISGMHTIANDKRLNRDNARGDVQVLKQYLNLRSGFKQMLSLQKLQGGSDSPDAVSNAGLMQQYSMAVSQLVESNTFFEQNMYNGLIERDPLLVDIAPTAAPTGGLLAA